VRPSAALGVLDITEWYGDTSGGIRTYLHEKMRHVDGDPSLRQVLVVPGAEDGWQDTAGTRMYRLHGPPIPRQRPYRFMLATRSVDAIVRHERPDVIEIGSPFVVPWIVRHATRHLDVPLVCYHHTDPPGCSRRRWGAFAVRGAWSTARSGATCACWTAASCARWSLPPRRRATSRPRASTALPRCRSGWT
jgi:alpha-1,6-mannosyltransferase